MGQLPCVALSYRHLLGVAPSILSPQCRYAIFLLQFGALFFSGRIRRSTDDVGWLLVQKTDDIYPIGSMYGIFTNIYRKSQPNVGKYTIHGSYGYWNSKRPDHKLPNWLVGDIRLIQQCGWSLEKAEIISQHEVCFFGSSWFLPSLWKSITHVLFFIYIYFYFFWLI